MSRRVVAVSQRRCGKGNYHLFIILPSYTCGLLSKVSYALGLLPAYLCPASFFLNDTLQNHESNGGVRLSLARILFELEAKEENHRLQPSIRDSGK